ncbi:MAG TPA: molybdopterin cofactor-binding domain-containing protein, partial [Planctomycetota bacterium]|nr:molybdopterin cofactor-binding domain-containing protein [Planctomycetota bacterium]
MRSPPPELEFSEPERYELHEGRPYHFELSRRHFVQVLGAGLVISVAVPSVFGQRSGRGQRGEGGGSIGQRLHMGADGTITVLTSKVEVGQGSRTQITQAAAEELHVPVERIRLIMADSAVVPDDGGTAGSRTTPSTVPAVRRACAAARQLLVDSASAGFGVDAKGLSVRDGKVEGLPPDKQLSYADLGGEKHAEALKRDIAPGVTVAEVAQWRVLGTPVPKVGAIEIVTGAHEYPSDIVRPGMLHGSVLRPASYGAQLTEIDLAPARAMTGVTAVHDGDFVGLAAPTLFAAELARDETRKTARWKTVEHPSSDDLYAHLRSTASQRSRSDRRGMPDEAFKSAAKVLRESYHIAYIQHAPMEPRAAVAEWNGDQLTVWTGTQQPTRVKQDLARTLGIPAERVRVVVPDTGGGFGGKHSGEAAVEAARLSLAAKKPVSLRWSREEEFTWAYSRPAGVIDVAGGLDDKGALTAWQHVNFNSGASAIATPYEIPNVLTEFKSCDQPLRSGSYRALASAANAFARESFMDELAAVSGADPLEFRLRHLTNDRMRAVLLAAVERFGWRGEWKSNSSRASTGIGLACGTEKGSYVACCARIEVNERDGTFKVVKVVEAFECGAIQNPANLRAQVEGCVIQGLGGALTEEMRFKDGKVLNARFSRYRVPRFKDVPEIDTVLVNRPDLPSVGGGETPIIG